MSDDKIVTFEGNSNKPADLDIDKFADEVFKEDAVILDYLQKAEQREAEAAKPKEEYLLICGACECRTFNLYAGGVVKCSFCEAVLKEKPTDVEDRRWRSVVPDAPSNPENVPTADDGYITENQLPDYQLARRRVLKLINAWADDNHLVLVGGYNRRGEGRWWLDAKTEEEREWLKDKIGQVFEWVTEVKLDARNELQSTPNE